MIATVLLIAFAVALGAVVMNWGKDYVVTTAKDAGDKSALELSCQQDIELAVKEIAGVPILCYNATGTSNTSYIEVMLENNGAASITGMRFVTFDENDNLNITTNTSFAISSGGVSQKKKIYHNLAGNITQVEFVPMIKPRGAVSSSLCSKNALVEDDLVACT